MPDGLSFALQGFPETRDADNMQHLEFQNDSNLAADKRGKTRIDPQTQLASARGSARNRGRYR